MTEQYRQEGAYRQLSESVAGIMRAGGDLQAQVRDLMLEAFSSGHLDLRQIREVTRAVLDGIAGSGESAGSDAVMQSLGGVSAALQQAAEASRLAIEEASGRVTEFSRHDLKQAVADLGTIEQLFLETLRDTASAGTRTVSTIFADYVAHIQRGNSSLANRLQEIMHELGRTLPGHGGKGLHAGMEFAQAATGELARLASSALSALHPVASQDGERQDGDGPGDAD